MESGKMLLVALISAVSTYAAVTAWPAIKELTAPEISGAAVASEASLPAALPIQTSLPGSSSPVQSGKLATAPNNSTSSAKRGGVRPADISGQLLPAVSWDHSRIKYARVTVVLHAKPGGAGVRPVSLNKAPLTVLRGTRLMPVKEQGSWVMVQAPSAQAGWVMARDLTGTRPVTVDHYKLR